MSKTKIGLQIDLTKPLKKIFIDYSKAIGIPMPPHRRKLLNMRKLKTVLLIEAPWTNDYYSGKKSETTFRCKFCPHVSLQKKSAILHAATVHGIRPVLIFKDGSTSIEFQK